METASTSTTTTEAAGEVDEAPVPSEVTHHTPTNPSPPNCHGLHPPPKMPPLPTPPPFASTCATTTTHHPYHHQFNSAATAKDHHRPFLSNNNHPVLPTYSPSSTAAQLHAYHPAHQSVVPFCIPSIETHHSLDCDRSTNLHSTTTTTCPLAGAPVFRRTRSCFAPPPPPPLAPPLFAPMFMCPQSAVHQDKNNNIDNQLTLKQSSSSSPRPSAKSLHQAEKELNAAEARERRRLKILSRFKTELCKAFAETGECAFGDKCSYAHGKEELKEEPQTTTVTTASCTAVAEEEGEVEALLLHGVRSPTSLKTTPGSHSITSSPTTTVRPFQLSAHGAPSATHASLHQTCFQNMFHPLYHYHCAQNELMSPTTPSATTMGGLTDSGAAAYSSAFAKHMATEHSTTTTTTTTTPSAPSGGFVPRIPSCSSISSLAHTAHDEGEFIALREACHTPLGWGGAAMHHDSHAVTKTLSYSANNHHPPHQQQLTSASTTYSSRSSFSCGSPPPSSCIGRHDGASQHTSSGHQDHDGHYQLLCKGDTVVEVCRQCQMVIAGGSTTSGNLCCRFGPFVAPEFFLPPDKLFHATRGDGDGEECGVTASLDGASQSCATSDAGAGGCSPRRFTHNPYARN